MDEFLSDERFREQARDLAAAVRFLAERGWTPATSSNFSVRLSHLEQRFAISRSGKDKYAFSEQDVMIIDAAGQAVAPRDARPSAETLLHTLLYRDAAIGSVLHTHSRASTLLTMRDQSSELVLEGFELLKGLHGVQTHEHREIVPIFDNDQDMTRLAALVGAYWDQHPDIHGFLIRGHGLYTWGRTLAEARRHVETFEFLFDCALYLKE